MPLFQAHVVNYHDFCLKQNTNGNTHPTLIEIAHLFFPDASLELCVEAPYQSTSVTKATLALYGVVVEAQYPGQNPLRISEDKDNLAGEVFAGTSIKQALASYLIGAMTYAFDISPITLGRYRNEKNYQFRQLIAQASSTLLIKL